MNKKPTAQMKLETFIIQYWGKNKCIPSLRLMCEALDYATCAVVSNLLYRMRKGKPLVKKTSSRATPENDDQHVYAWRQRRYLRYRAIYVPRSRNIHKLHTRKVTL